MKENQRSIWNECDDTRHTSLCIPTRRKNIYSIKKMDSLQNRGNTQQMNHAILQKNINISKYHSDIDDDWTESSDNTNYRLYDPKIQKIMIFNKFQSASYQPADFLQLISSDVSKNLISTKNYEVIMALAKKFPGKLTSFFGFESRLTTDNSTSDFLFAISSNGGEKEQLMEFFQNKENSFLNKNIWTQIYNFTVEWLNPQSIVSRNVLGIWLEFDTSENNFSNMIPSVYMHTTNINSKSEFRWLTTKALPLLLGNNLNEKITKKLMECFCKLPKNSAVFQVGAMLSRGVDGVRIVIKRIDVDEILPYLQSIGWNDDSNKLGDLLEELKKYVNRFVLHLHVTENVHLKIGLECSFYQDEPDQEKKWNNLFKFLQSKGLCIAEKYDALMDFPGVMLKDSESVFNFDEYSPISVLQKNPSQSALYRFISHVKINYTPNQPVDAKAYCGVRLLGSDST